MGGEHQLHAHLRQRLGVHGFRPHGVARRLALIGDVGEIEKLVEGADKVREIVPGQGGEAVAEHLPILGGAAARPFRQSAHHLDAGNEIVAAMVRDDVAEETAEQPHVVAQRPRQAGQATALELPLRLDHVSTIASLLRSP